MKSILTRQDELFNLLVTLDPKDLQSFCTTRKQVCRKYIDNKSVLATTIRNTIRSF
jgi:hypothetical protein